MKKFCYFRGHIVVVLSTLLTVNIAANAQNHSTAIPSPYSKLAPSQAARHANQFNAQREGLAGDTATPAPSPLPAFVDHREYVAADGPINIAIGDLNGDGIGDMVIPNTNSTDVSVLLGNRNGSFKQFVLFDTGGSDPFHVAIADFNGDGKNDVAVTTLSGVSILLGDGHGHLGAPTILPAGTSPARIAVADFNGDNKLDLAVTNLGSNNFSIFLGNGDGTFAPAANVAVGMGPAGIAVGDFNHDGKADLAVVNTGEVFGQNKGSNGNTVAILLGNGTGGFGAPTFLPTSKEPLVVLVADFNKDGKQDLIVSCQTNSLVSEFLGNGDGTFQAPRTFPSGLGANNMALADFNGDGSLDVALTNFEANQVFSTISVLFGDGTGNFKAPVNAPAGRNPGAVAAGDFNNDGKADYITTNLDSNTAAVVLGNGNGTFRNISLDISEGDVGAFGMVAADFNNDGIADLAISNSGLIGAFGQNISILLGKKNGNFGSPTTFATDKDPQGLVAADLNQDGHLDLVVANGGDFTHNIPGSVGVLLGKGDGTFQAQRSFAPGSGIPTSIAVADFNGDGHLDVAAAQFGAGTGNVSLFLGDGTGGLGTPTVLNSGGDYESLLMTDFNGDGKADLVYYDSFNLSVFVQLGNGNGTFKTPEAVVVSLFLSGVLAVADFNHDGIADLAVEETGQIQIFLGDGKGGFTSAGTFLEGTGSGFSAISTLVIADFNGDGFLDIAATDGFDELVIFLPGIGDGTFGTASAFGGDFTDAAVAIDQPGFQPGLALATEVQQLRVIRNTTPAKQ
jgi:hypothetical protein